MDPELSNSHLIEVLIIILCLIFSALFSASETAITSYNEFKAKHLLKKLGPRAAPMEYWLRHPTRVLTTILLGATLANIGGSAVATGLFLETFPEGGIVLTTLVMTVLLLFFGEVIPKTLAKVHSESLALPALKFIRFVNRLLYPVVALFTWFAEKAIRMASNGRQSGKAPAITEDELSFLINMGESEGALEREKRLLLDNVFEFGNTIVREVMIPRPDMIVIPHDLNADEAVQVILEKGHSRLPVYEDRIDNIIGTVHVKEILRKIKETKSLGFRVREVMREPVIVPDTKPVHELLMEMRFKKRQMAIVVDEYGSTAGLITFEDLIEEIVGEVRDEYDEQEEDLIKELSTGRYQIDTRLNYEEFLQHFETQLGDAIDGRGDDVDGDPEVDHDAEFDTVGGFLTDALGHIPKIGERVRFRNATFTIKEASRRSVRRVELAFDPKPVAQDAELESERRSGSDAN